MYSSDPPPQSGGPTFATAKASSMDIPTLSLTNWAFVLVAIVQARDENDRENRDAKQLGDSLRPGSPRFVAHAVIRGASCVADWGHSRADWVGNHPAIVNRMRNTIRH